MKPEIRTVAAQRSWIVESRSIELSLTIQGGMMAPVLFCRDTKKPVQPYYVSPWQEEQAPIDEPVLKPLRGDFFCMPFGADNRYQGETHVVHGEPATGIWTAADLSRSDGVTRFEARMKTTVRAGEVIKRIALKDEQNAVYTQHELIGYSGKTTLGHHATLSPGPGPGGMLISTSPISFGLARPAVANHTADGEYLSLDGSKPFRSLEKVPTVWKDPAHTDLTVFPARPGYCDIAGVVSRGAVPASGGKKPRGNAAMVPAWTTAVFPGGGYLWYSLKDPRLLPVTLFWMENHGRHGAPWSGRNLCIGLEDICGYLAEGLAPSARKNPISAAGVPTVVTLSPRKPTTVNYIQGVSRVPTGFDRVTRASFGPGGVRFASASGATVDVAVDWEFLQTGTVT